MYKKIKIKAVSAKELYDILEEELKGRIRELESFDSNDDEYLNRVADVQIIVNIQDALDNEDVLTVKGKKELGKEPIFEFVINRYFLHTQTVEISLYNLEFFFAVKDNTFKVIYN